MTEGPGAPPSGSPADPSTPGPARVPEAQDPRRRGRVETGTPGRRCELCGGPVLDRHCKVVCLNCGFQRDCSDP